MAQRSISEASSAERSPDEIWSGILEPIEARIPSESWARPVTNDSPKEAKDLASISHIPQNHHSVASANLYGTLNVESFPHSSSSKLLLLAALADQPSLGENVRNLRMISSKLYGKPHLENEWNKVFLSVWKRIEEGGISNQAKNCLMHWIGNEPKAMSEIATPFVALLPGLELLECEVDRRDLIINYIRHMPSLTEVRLRTILKDRSPSVAEIELALVHPTIKIVRLEGFSWTMADAKVLNSTYGADTLDLANFVLDAGGLSDIFLRFQNLIHLSCEFSGTKRPIYQPFTVVKMSELGELLRSNGKSLETLTLNTIHLARSMEIPDNSYLGSLKELTLLKHLEICHHLLVNKEADKDAGWDLIGSLPSQLQSIHFLPKMRMTEEGPSPANDEAFLKIVVRDLLENDSKFHCLKKVSVELSNKQLDILREGKEMIEQGGEWTMEVKHPIVSMTSINKAKGIEYFNPTVIEFHKGQDLSSAS